MKRMRIDPEAESSPYEQIRIQLATMVVDGDLAPGQKLPTVRQLAVDLGLAANTVARAYRELEADGILSTQGRRGTFVRSALLDDGAHPRRYTEAQAAAASFTATTRALGLSLAETSRLVEGAWPRRSSCASSVRGSTAPGRAER